MKLKKINDCVSTQNKNFDFFINCECEFVIEFDNSFLANIKSNCFCNTDIINLNIYLSFDIDCFKSGGYKFCNINLMTSYIISDRCNMTYENYINQPMHMCERKINMNNARNPHLINL